MCESPPRGTSPLQCRVAEVGVGIAVGMVAEGRNAGFGASYPNIAPFNSEMRFPPFDHRASGCFGDRRRGRSVEDAQPVMPWSRVAVADSVRRGRVHDVGGARAFSTGYPRARSPDSQAAVGRRWERGAEFVPGADRGPWSAVAMEAAARHYDPKHHASLGVAGRQMKRAMYCHEGRRLRASGLEWVNTRRWA